MKKGIFLGAFFFTAIVFTSTAQTPAEAGAKNSSGPLANSSSTNENIWSGVAVKELARITVDCSEVPELKQWAQHAGELCVEWYPKICDLLPSDGFVPPKLVRLKFEKDMDGVASTSRDVINISANYVKNHTDDFGMVIHELTHVAQDYGRRRNPGWLVEGVADYIRIVHFEPNARRPRLDPDKIKYTDAYKTTAIFLEWIEKTHDR
ncbi:MAG: basic secretory protein-like protein, partial [Verrucomicrobiota bacterium]